MIADPAGSVSTYTGMLVIADEGRRRRLRRLLARGASDAPAGPPVEWLELAAPPEAAPHVSPGTVLAILDCGSYPPAERIGRLAASAPGMGLIALGDSDESTAFAAVLAAGADEYLPWPHLTPAWLRHAIRRTLARCGGRTAGQTARVAEAVEFVQADIESVDYRRLRAVLDALPVGVYIADAEGRLIEANAAAEAVWGMDIPRVGPERFGLFRARWRESGEPVRPEEWGLARAVEKGETSIAEAIEIETFDGQTRSILNYALPIYDAAGRLLGGVAVNVDITAQRQAEDEARRARDLLYTVVNRIEDIFWAVDREWRFTYVNRPLLEMQGGQAEELLGRNMWETWPVLLSTIYEEHFRHAVQSQELARFEAPSPLFPDCYYSVVAYPSSDGLSVFARDMSVRRQAEQERERLAAALAAANEELEQRVGQRTRELVEAVGLLRREVAAGEHMAAMLAEVRARLGRAGEAERLLLAQELHDGPLQELITLGYELTALMVAAPEAELRRRLALLRTAVSETAAGLRRVAQDLRPPLLVHFGLAAALRGQVEQAQAAQPQMAIRFDSTGEAEQAAAALAEPAALALFRICQQALRNAAQHSGATALAVRLYMAGEGADEGAGGSASGRVLVLEVEDDGRGFSAPPDWVELARQGHLGLAGMNERAAAAGGSLELRSQPGAGAVMRVRVPLAGA